MNHDCTLSHVAQNYLSAYREILDRMIREMTGAEWCDSISHNFIVQMIPHHRAAIEMSHNILQYTTNVPLQEIASRIILEQTKSIENLERSLEACGQYTNSDQELCMYRQRVESILNVMFSGMRTACATNQINADFMREMIPHHLGAVEMSCTALRYELCPELIPILDAIISSQRKGIRQMQCLLRAMGC